jgi:hypothetical protein
LDPLPGRAATDNQAWKTRYTWNYLRNSLPFNIIQASLIRGLESSALHKEASPAPEPRNIGATYISFSCNHQAAHVILCHDIDSACSGRSAAQSVSPLWRDPAHAANASRSAGDMSSL